MSNKENKYPDCFIPEKNNSYPLCAGRNFAKCKNCQLREDWEPEDQYED